MASEPDTSTATFSGMSRESVPFFPVTCQRAVSHFHLHAGGDDHRLLADSRHLLFLRGKNRDPHYQTSQSSSPPMDSFFAFSPVMTPFDVETMATPNPFFTVGISSLPT